MMHKAGRNDTKNPGASVKQDKTLGDYIQRKEQQMLVDHKLSLTEYERGYQDGYYDCIVDGKNKGN